ncbi:FecR domain-containing protein [Delftia tsuruhatensis]
MRDLIQELVAHYGDLRRQLTRDLRDPHYAADIAQSSFERVYVHALGLRSGKKAETLPDAGIESPRALLFRVARNLCIDDARKRKTAQEWTRQQMVVQHSAPSSETLAAQRQILNRVVQALEGLPPRRREVFILFAPMATRARNRRPAQHHRNGRRQAHGARHTGLLARAGPAALRTDRGPCAGQRHGFRQQYTDRRRILTPLSMASAPSERMVEHALTLIVQSEIAPDPVADQARLTLGEWRGKSARHDAAAREAHLRWNLLGGMSGGLREQFQETALLADRASRSTQAVRRRKLLLSFAGLLGTGTLAGRGAYWYWQQPIHTSAYATRNSQILKITLADGKLPLQASLVELAPQSAIAVTLYRQRRSVSMARGEVRFDVAPDPDRPFEVITREARIEVVGTVFTVRDRGGPVTVGVEHGHVRVRVLGRDAQDATGPAAATLDLLPGQIVHIRNGQAEAVRQADAATLSAWREGWLVFENTPLAEALATVNAYRTQPIEAADARGRAAPDRALSRQ